MEILNTRYYKDHNGSWAAKTTVTMPNNMHLSVRSYKGRGEVTTVASVGHISADGMGVSTLLFSDFNVTLPGFKAGRLSEKVIKEAHDIALQGLENIKADVIAFYAARPDLIQRPDVTE